MKTFPACLPCLQKSACDYVRRCTACETIRRNMLDAAFESIRNEDKSMPPPYLAWKFREAADRVNPHEAADCFAEEKKQSTILAKELLALLRQDPAFQHMDFETGIRLAAAGNIIDFGIYTDLKLDAVAADIRRIMVREIDLAAVKRLELAVRQAKKILYVLDNCGEAVFDAAFMEPWKEKVTVCLRQERAFNDVTPWEFEESGFANLPYVTNGSTMNGLIPELAGPEFKAAFEAADLILAKGQGNFECLSDIEKPTGFIFLAKCPVVTKLLHVPEKSIQIRTKNF